MISPLNRTPRGALLRCSRLALAPEQLLAIIESIYLSIYLSIFLSIYISLYKTIYIYIYIYS